MGLERGILDLLGAVFNTNWNKFWNVYYDFE